MLTKEVMNCSFSKWFQQFSQISIQTKIIRVSEEFVSYLLSDGIVLPKNEFDVIYENPIDSNDDWSSDHQNPDSEDDNQSSDGSVVSDIEFPELELQISETLQEFGSVFPKLNWSSCEDSKWISASGTRCRQSQDIYLLLKSSDRVVHDLTQPFEFCSDLNNENPPKVEYELILKKWIDINPSMEFRCFVSNNTLIAISQRDVRSYYQHIGQHRDEIIEDIHRFFTINMKNKFLDNSFVIDVYRPERGRVILIDINPFGLLTDSLLFDWDQLNDSSLEVSVPEFRYLTNDMGIQTQTYSMNSLPIEVNYGYNLNDLMNGCHVDR